MIRALHSSYPRESNPAQELHLSANFLPANGNREGRQSEGSRSGPFAGFSQDWNSDLRMIRLNPSSAAFPWTVIHACAPRGMPRIDLFRIIKQ
jgi:hypothetical protein